MAHLLRLAGCGVALVAVLAVLVGPRAASADSQSREASAHFQRGVDLYNDGDYRGALVEFKKAYTVWPRANVLYDIGETEFQLLDYASALKTFERYLADTGPSAVHRQEVENTVETLRGRVGRIALAVDAGDCDVSIDDQPAGTTPLSGPLVVSVGPRKLAVTCPGRSPVTRRVEVAAAETVRLELKLRPPASATAPLGASAAAAPPRHEHNTRQGMVIGWTLSALLVAATVGVGAGTLVEQSRLEAMKSSFPVQKSELDRQGSLTLGLSITADILGVAALTTVGVATWLTVKHEREKKLHVGSTGRGFAVATTF